MVRQGELERAVMDALWAAPEGMAAGDVVAALPGRALAVTTVLTVLERLRRKGLADRDRDGRAYRYRAAAEREALVAQAMLTALGDSADRALAISRFVDSMPAEDVEALRRALPPARGVRRVSAVERVDAVPGPSAGRSGGAARPSGD